MFIDTLHADILLGPLEDICRQFCCVFAPGPQGCKSVFDQMRPFEACSMLKVLQNLLSSVMREDFNMIWSSVWFGARGLF